MIQLPYEIKPKRIYSLIAVPFVIGLVSVFIYFLFIKKEDSEGNKFTWDAYLVFSFLILVGLLLIYQFIKGFFKPMILFRMDEAGIVYNGNGMKFADLKWNEISEVKEIEIMVTRNRRPAKETVLGVFLKDPEKFRNKKNLFLKKMLKISDTLYDTSIIIEPVTFGKDYTAVKNKMQEIVALTNQRGPGYVAAVSEQEPG